MADYLQFVRICNTRSKILFRFNAAWEMNNLLLAPQIAIAQMHRYKIGFVRINN